MTKSNKNVFLFAATGAVNLMSFSTGTSYSWTSSSIPKLQSTDPAINPLMWQSGPITATDASWITALISLGAALGTFVAGHYSHRIGRKKTLLIFALPMLISYLIKAFARNVILIYCSRLLLGLGNGCSFSIIPMYVAELSQNHNRGQLGCLMALMQGAGILFCYIIGPYASIKLLSLCCIAPLCLFLVIVGLFVPDSPYYFIEIGDDKGAELALRKLRDASDDAKSIQKELLEIKTLIHNNISEQEKTNNNNRFWDLIQSKATIICVGIMFAQQFSGITPVLSNMQSIFDAAATTQDNNNSTLLLSPDLSVIIIGAIQFVTVAISSQLVDRVGRRFLLLISLAGAFLSLLCLGLFFYLRIDSLFWLPIASLVVYIIFYNIGLGPIPWPIMGELMPTHMKALGSSVTTSVCLSLAFLITLSFPKLLMILGMAQTYWMFAVCCCVAIGFIGWILPETKGKSFDEIQTILSCKK